MIGISAVHCQMANGVGIILVLIFYEVCFNTGNVIAQPHIPGSEKRQNSNPWLIHAWYQVYQVQYQVLVTWYNIVRGVYCGLRAASTMGTWAPTAINNQNHHKHKRSRSTMETIASHTRSMMLHESIVNTNTAVPGYVHASYDHTSKFDTTPRYILL